MNYIKNFLIFAALKLLLNWRNVEKYGNIYHPPPGDELGRT
jgi:hypothetical protein